jgi:hypothetical protein
MKESSIILQVLLHDGLAAVVFTTLASLVQQALQDAVEAFLIIKIGADLQSLGADVFTYSILDNKALALAFTAGLLLFFFCHSYVIVEVFVSIFLMHPFNDALSFYR